jgi:predicted amidohydrolase
MKSVKIALAQLLVEGGEPQRNIERAEKLVKLAAEAHCDVVLLPETIDFAWTHPSAKVECEPIPGKYSDIFCEIARTNNIYICVGLTEKRQNKRFNTALLINNEGNVIIKYSKINLLVVEHDYYDVGTTLNVVDTPFGKIGVNICADNYYNSLSIAHTLAKMGAQIILSPSSWTVDYSITEEQDPYNDKWIKPLSEIAELYNIIFCSTTSVGYIVGGPYEGKKMVGCSLAVNKNGVIAQGLMNEFAGDIVMFETEVPENEEKGTQISERFKTAKH